MSTAAAKPVRAHFRLRFYGMLPADDTAGDDRFDEWEEAIVEALNAHTFGLGIEHGSFSVVDGDTEAAP